MEQRISVKQDLAICRVRHSWFAAALACLAWAANANATLNVHLLKDIALADASSSPAGFVAFQNRLFFQASDATNGSELWVTDGTAANTQLFLNVAGDTGSVNSSSPRELTVFAGKLYFSASDGSAVRDLWSTTGAAGNLVRWDVNPGLNADPRHMTVAGTRMFFAAVDIGAGNELRFTDGTTVLPVDINPTGDSNPAEFVALGTTVFFTADNGANGREVWMSNGVATSMLADIAPGALSSYPAGLAVFQDKLYFSADDGTGSQLWVSTGVSGDAQAVKPGPVAGNFRLPSRLTPVGNTLFMAARGEGPLHPTGVELWSTDGTLGSLDLVSDIDNSAHNSNPSYLTAFNGTLVFSAASPTFDNEPWVSDGVTTTRLADINLGSAGSDPGPFAELLGWLYFPATTAAEGRELWRTDGGAITELVANIYPDTPTVGGSNPSEFAILGPHMIFAATTPSEGREVWITNQSPEIAEGASVSVTMSENGTPIPFSLTLNASDADGDALTWSVTAPATHGTASASGTGTSQPVGYEPNLDYFGTDSFVVTVDDGNGGTASCTINVTIEWVNRVPVITEGASVSVIMSENGMPIPFGLVLNATDFDGDALTWSVTSPAAHGVASASGTGPSQIVGYEPNLDYFGSDSFVVSVEDSNGGTDSCTVYVTIQSNNQPPVITQGASVVVVMSENGSPIPFSLTLNATDLEGDPLSWSIKTPPTHGTASARGTGTSQVVGYTPALNYAGSDSFVVNVNDGNGGMDACKVNVFIQAVNQPPAIAEGASVAVTMSPNGVPVPFSLTLHATDPDGDTLTWSVTTPAAHGTASASGIGAIRVVSYSPMVDYVGADSFVVRVADGNGGTASCKVNVTIKANHPPVANAGPDRRVRMGQPVILNGSGSTDPDGDPLTYRWTLMYRPPGSTATLTGATTAYPRFMASKGGFYVIQLVVNDGTVNSPPDRVIVRTSTSSFPAFISFLIWSIKH